jgi:hypothetical protein
MKRVVCSNVFQNVGTSREHKNDQVFTQGFFVFLGGEYNETNESKLVYLKTSSYSICTSELAPF